MLCCMNNLVSTDQNGGQLRMFGTIQWEWELYRGRPKARCNPFNLDGHQFWGENPQVLIRACYMTCYTIQYITLCGATVKQEQSYGAVFGVF